MLQLLFLILISLWAEEPEPFWRAKERVYKRVQNGEIVVSVKSESRSRAEQQMAISGGGQVKAPYEFVFKEALDFDNLSEVTGYIKAARYDKSKGHLALDLEALGRKATMELKLSTAERDGQRELNYTVVRGPLLGLHGRFLFTPQGAVKSEVGIEGRYRYDNLPMPEVFANFAMEVIFQRVAARLRGHVESKFKGQSQKSSQKQRAK